MTNEELLTNLRAGIDSAASTVMKESLKRNHAWGRGAKTAFTAVYHMLDLATLHITEPRDAGPTETEPTVHTDAVVKASYDEMEERRDAANTAVFDDEVKPNEA